MDSTNILTQTFTVRELMKRGASVTASLPLNCFTPRVVNAAAKALKQGYIATSRGEAAVIYRLLLEAFDMPGMLYSHQGAWWRSMEIFNGSKVQGLEPVLHDWWVVDRAAWRMDDSEGYHRMVELAKRSRYHRDHTEEPRWSSALLSRRFDLPIKSTKIAECMEPIGAAVRATPGYDKFVEQALELLSSGAVLNVTTRLY